MLDAGREIVRDTIAREFERKHLPGRMLIETDDVKAVTGSAMANSPGRIRCRAASNSATVWPRVN